MNKPWNPQKFHSILSFVLVSLWETGQDLPADSAAGEWRRASGDHRWWEHCCQVRPQETTGHQSRGVLPYLSGHGQEFYGRYVYMHGQAKNMSSFFLNYICTSLSLSGNIDANTYEDTCREMFGVHAFVVFTVDRLMQNIVRQVIKQGCPLPQGIY